MRYIETAAMALTLSLVLFASGAEAGVVVLDISGPVTGGAIVVGLHDDFLGIENCGGTCNAPAVCHATVNCAPGASPSTVASALAAQFAANTGCLSPAITAVANPGAPGRLVLSWPDSVELNVCVGGALFRDRSRCCGAPVVSPCGTFTCVETTPSPYCTAGASASGCLAVLTVAGAASATASTGFRLTSTLVEGNSPGLFFFGVNGRQANPWGNGTSSQCVVPPVKRGTLLPGSGPAGLCIGTLSQDVNALWCPGCPRPGHNPGAGAVVQAQLWYHDPQNTSNRSTSLSNAVEFSVGP